MDHMNNHRLLTARKIDLGNELPPPPEFAPGIRRAPNRGFKLTKTQAATALKNALRYVPESLHAKLAPEFMEELYSRGRIYAYRYRPEGRIWGRSIDHYQGKCLEGKALQAMIDNNLDFDVALYPYELVTYGESGQVFQNWLQYRLVMAYLQNLESDQTLVIQSGHPLGIFRSSVDAPRVINSNGIMVGAYDNQADWDVAAQMGVTNYGQMTAGGWFFIGPQGIIHGCYSMLLGAARKAGIGTGEDLKGVLYVSAGIGSISSAQPKAAQISGCAAIIAEVNNDFIDSRLKKGWLDDASTDLDTLIDRAVACKNRREGVVLAYRGNVVDLLERLTERNVTPDILSDQTSCHIPYDGGYTPQGISYDQGRELLVKDRKQLRRLVDQSLRVHWKHIKTLTDRGAWFLEYGNSIMAAMVEAGVTELAKNGKDSKDGFIFPDFIEAITGPDLFDYGYGPFRWVCLSGNPSDLEKTDRAAMDCIDPDRRPQDRDNYNWIRHAGSQDLVIGTQARMLYQDMEGRTRIALRFNHMVRNGEVGPIMMGRDHHDTGGADCPTRETANIKDGSNVTADMAVHCYAGNAARGMTFISLHNGGGVGIGRSIHSGFALLLDGSDRVDQIIRLGVCWDVMGGVARRSWARNDHSMEVAAQHNESSEDTITLPWLADEDLIQRTVDQVLGESR
ncbi:urocanate hydratase [Dethiosulfovibrio sp. F2B]|uniref:urocanate hydratase n=1 Tax=Dethiosulfovibrio faecalis TaxID=2720018 RepID=UPI001F38A03F|nr:urocanate hydratase [Dethiosulfovibrio faecalis]MCF4152394.1 urocanate hydratase [Dethiosulfovibrio faecalis]